jgi:uncharacterized RDD family membrane protein YckC
LPSWKQEVNQRLAAHKNRKGSASAAETQEAVQNAGTSLAAQAAARVAARYAKAPSYSELQAAETRVAVRAAEIATKVALEAQANAESALAEMHAAANSRGPAVVETFAAPARKPETEQENQAQLVESAQLPVETRPQPMARPSPEPGTAAQAAAAQPDLFFTQPLSEGQSFGIRWEPDLPARPVERKVNPSRRQEGFSLSAADWWTPGEVSATLRNEPIEIVEPEPGHANLIEFPRELVATRKMRPRMAEAAYGAATEAEGQLSIFEVDPRSVSTEVESPDAMQEPGIPSWNGASGAEWSGMELDAQPAAEVALSSEANAAQGPFLAPLGLRLMAIVVDGALILGAFFTAAFVAVARMQNPPAGKPAEMMALVALMITGLAFYAVFFSLSMSTPGMKYAGIGLCTFHNDSPARAQLWRRLGAMVLSLLPVGLGFVWSVFDDDHLSWHDRFSQTYLRKL